MARSRGSPRCRRSSACFSRTGCTSASPKGWRRRGSPTWRRRRRAGWRSASTTARSASGASPRDSCSGRSGRAFRQPRRFSPARRSRWLRACCYTWRFLMPRILVTNDDGVHSEGIHALAGTLRRLGDVVVVAPHVEASAIGHALTLRRPLRMEHLRENVYEVDGTPTDCVNVAITKLYAGGMPDLVVSGIHKGLNIGDDLTYSGTVSGALEAALLGVPAIAVSL